MQMSYCSFLCSILSKFFFRVKRESVLLKQKEAEEKKKREMATNGTGNGVSVNGKVKEN